jgi:hypothetical protein
MSQFSYAQYQQVVAQAQASGEGTKVGFFKLKDDGDIAIARLNISCNEDMNFASVHTIGAGGRWMKVSCLNPLGSYGGDCALCAAHAANPKGAVSKSAKKLFIQMMVSYRDAASTTGYTPPAPVIWDRPAAFSRELANKLMIAGDLRNTLVLITRNGKAGDMQTTYSMDILPADHPIFKPEMIPADFSAFNNFNIARHSYWEKTADEINTYLTTGQFPERAGNNAAPAATAQPAPAAYAAPTYAAASTTGGYVNPSPTVAAPVAPAAVPVAPVVQPAAVTPVAAPTAAPVAPATTAVPPTADGAPARNFTAFSF